MKTDLSENLIAVADILTSEECHKLIQRGESLGFARAAVRTRSGPQMLSNIRDNDRVEFTDTELATELWQRCELFLPRPLEGGVPVGLDEGFRLYRYDVGQRFKRHRDGIVERSVPIRSRLTFLIYLNEDFQGGETVFYSDESVQRVRPEIIQVSPQIGMGLFFLHEWWHEGRELTSGRKYVLRSDVFYQFPD